MAPLNVLAGMRREPLREENLKKTGSNVCPKPTRPLAALKPQRVSVKQLAGEEEEDTMCATVPSLRSPQHAAAVVHFHTNSFLTYFSSGAGRMVEVKSRGENI